ncbi:MAG: UbiA family prenyltransferase [Maritimibacter sp.]
MAEKTPLVLDVDGTFLRTDLLFESFWAGLGQAPWATLKAAAFHITRPEKLKSKLADIVQMRMDLMPVHKDVATAARTAKLEKREVVLASASDKRLVAQLAADYALSPRVFGSDAAHNLKGARKATELVAAFGDGKFDYAGNDKVDREVWAHARKAIVVGDTASADMLEAVEKPVVRLPSGQRPERAIHALRPHQWVKNVLLFVPLLAAHEFGWPTILAVLMGIISFSLAASAIYVVNDLLDLEADRLHVKKRFRPFASGDVPIGTGMLIGAMAAAVALTIASVLSPAFLGIIVLYMSLSLAYSLKLKRMRWIDIVVLAALYTLRVVAGAFASGVPITGYLLVFIFPVFLTLGCVKRMTEVTLADTDARLPGRGYAKADRGDLLNVAMIGMAGALLSFFMYSFTAQAQSLYPTQWLVWATLLPITWWLVRMVRLGFYGKQDHDPIVFAMKDKRGIGILLIALGLLFQAAGLWEQYYAYWLG